MAGKMVGVAVHLGAGEGNAQILNQKEKIGFWIVRIIFRGE